MNDSVGGAPAMGSSRNLITGGRRPFAGASRLPGSFNVIPDWQRRVDPSGQLLPSETGTGSGPAEVQATVAAKNALVPILYGGYERVAGKVYFVGSNGTYLFVVYIFCEGPIAEITSANVEINDLPYSSYVGTLLNLYDGSQVAADPYMSGNFGWTETLNGYAYAVLVVSQIAGGVQGFPRLTAKLKGFPVYDPRLGSPSASAWSDNPALILADFITRYSGKTVDDASLIAAANACDALVSSTGSPTVSEKFSRLTILLREKRTVPEWIDILRGYLPGWVQDHGTHYSIVVDVAGHSVAHVFGSHNIAQDPSPRLFLRGSRDLPDIVRVGYTDTGTTPWSTQYVDAGSGESKAVIELPGIRSSYQARRFAFTRYNHYHLEGIEGEISIFDYGLKVLPGDLATITESAWGWTAQPVRVLEAVDRGNGRWTIRFRVYDVAAYNDEMVATSSGTTTDLPSPYDVPAISSYTGTTELQYYGGRYHTHRRFTWEAPDWPFVQGYRVLLHDFPAGSPTLDGATIFDDRVIIGTDYYTPALTPNQSYSVWVAVISTAGVQGPWYHDGAWFVPQGLEQQGEEGTGESSGYDYQINRIYQLAAAGSPTVEASIGFSIGISGFPPTSSHVSGYMEGVDVRLSDGRVTRTTLSVSARDGVKSGGLDGTWTCYDSLSIRPSTTGDQALYIGPAKIVAAGFGSPSEERLDFYAGYWDPLGGLGGTPVPVLALSIDGYTGNVGIGVTPNYKLHVNNNHDPTSTTGYGAVVTSGFYGGGFTLVDTAHCGIYAQDAGETLKIYVGKSAGETAQASVVMVLTGTGNVGIGGAPGHPFDVQGNVNSSHIARIYNSNTGANAAAVLTLDAAGRIVSQIAHYSGQYFHELGSGIPARYSDFDTHYWRTSGGSLRMTLSSGGQLDLGFSNGNYTRLRTGDILIQSQTEYQPQFNMEAFYSSAAGLYVITKKSRGTIASPSAAQAGDGIANYLSAARNAGGSTTYVANITTGIDAAESGGHFGGHMRLALSIPGTGLTDMVLVYRDRLAFYSGFHVASATATGTTPALQSGYGFVPSFTAISLVSSFTGNNLTLNWKRLGNMVHCAGYGVVEVTANGLAIFRISLPIASNLTGAADLVGGVTANTALGVLTVGYIEANATYDQANFSINSTAAGLLYLRFWFMYEVK